MSRNKLVVVGGGTGTHTILRGLKFYQEKLKLSAIVTMADSGGSTGRLRDEFGYLPVGDVRMALTALASDFDEHEELLRELFLYRFDKGEGLVGHNFGNLLLVALTDILGSEEEAIRAASKVLRVKGAVVPVTGEHVNLMATYDDGVVITGEDNIDEPDGNRYNKKIKKLEITPHAKISQRARETLLTADFVVFGPGDLYTSILANCVVDGFAQTLADNHNAKLIYVSNLMTRAGQTDGFGVQEHILEIEKYIGRKLDYVVINSTPLPQDLLFKYEIANEFPVKDNLSDKSNNQSKIIRKDLLTTEIIKTVSGDTLRRSLIRHDSAKLSQQIFEIINSL